MYSLERFCLGWPWHEPKHAAALACELIRWATPKVAWADGDSEAGREQDRRNNAEVPEGDDPYRALGAQRVCVDPQEVTDARFYVANTLSWVTMFVDDTPIVAPKDFGDPDEHPLTRVYWYAAELGKQVEEACNRAGNRVYMDGIEQLKTQPAPKPKAGAKSSKHRQRDAFDIPDELIEARARWYAIGQSAKGSTEFLRKFASGSQVIGAADGIAGGLLNRIGIALANSGKPTEEITGRMFHWRVKDALKGKVLSPDMDANLRPAFEAAWSAGQYDFAYSLLQDLDQLAELP